MGNEFLTESAKASRVLAAARVRHARARQRADARLAAAQAVHTQEVIAAEGIEAEAWRAMMTVPGMTIATAARIGNVSHRAVHTWLAPRDQTRPSPCT